jgi:hypothetical protein
MIDYPMKPTYNSESDFQIFSTRLKALQAYINSQNPNKAKLLWKDRRDLLRWYTLWTVIIIGGIGILLAIVQVILSAFQVALAFESLRQGSNPGNAATTKG